MTSDNYFCYYSNEPNKLFFGEQMHNIIEPYLHFPAC